MAEIGVARGAELVALSHAMSVPPLPVRTISGRAIPAIMYGTAWKENSTEQLVADALAAGFRAIDTANQRKHYFEAGVGDAIAKSGIARDELFLQTKFTFRDGQDHRLPYDEHAPVAEQVAQSFASSLEHLQLDELDSYVLHGPSQSGRLGTADHDAWREMESLVDDGAVRFLGISNVSVEQLTELLTFARIKPTFAQIRCYASRSWDLSMRMLCAQHDIVYQGFSLLTANRKTMGHAGVAEIAKRHGKTPSQIVFRFALQLGMMPITGTSDAGHMRDDLSIGDFALSNAEMAIIDGAER